MKNHRNKNFPLTLALAALALNLAAIHSAKAATAPGAGTGFSHTATLLANGKVLVERGVPAVTNAFLFDPTTGDWTATGARNDQRYHHLAIWLPNGKVLTAAGTMPSIFGANGRAELYDPATGSWTPTGEMTTGRKFHTLTLLPNGKVLAAGGAGAASNATRTRTNAELYDPATGMWTPTGQMHGLRYGHTATLLPNGMVLVAGDELLSTAELYDPVSGTWTETGGLKAVRHYAAATLLANGKVLVTGGTGNPASGKTVASSSAELYDPATGTWSATGTMNYARANHTATLLPNGKVLVVGHAGAELYDPISGTWKVTGAPKAAGRRSAVTSLPNGKVLLAHATFNASVADSLEIYDPVTEKWSPPTR